MKSVFTFTNFRLFIKYSFAQQDKKGFGQASKLAKTLNVNSTFISQVLNQDKLLSPEQALLTAEFLNLNEIETEYFVLLVQKDRASTTQYSSYLDKQLAKIRTKSQDLVNRVKFDNQISEEQRAVFYSDWIYSAVRLSLLLPGLDTKEKLAERFSLPINKINDVIDFLLSAGLVQLENGKLSRGKGSTHLDSKSHWIKSHHSNWRVKAIQEMTHNEKNSLHYTAPMTLSKADAEKIREILIKSINQVDDVLIPSESQELFCLSIDWFRVI